MPLGTDIPPMLVIDNAEFSEDYPGVVNASVYPSVYIEKGSYSLSADPGTLLCADDEVKAFKAKWDNFDSAPGHGVVLPPSDDLPPTEFIPIEQILEHSFNWHTHDAVQIAEMRRSLDEFGMCSPATFNKTTGNLLDGHLRLTIAREDEEAALWCHVVHWPADKEKRYLLALTKIEMMGGVDNSKLKLLFESLEDTSDVPIGWTPQEMEEAVAWQEEADKAFEAPEDFPAIEVPTSVPTRTKAGDIWRVGAHTLAVMDSTDRDNIKRVLAAAGVAKVDVLFTDPPYLMSESGGKMGDTSRFKTVNKVAERKLNEFAPLTLLQNARVWFGWPPGRSKQNSFSIFAFCNDALQLDYMTWCRLNLGTWETLVWDKHTGIPFGDHHIVDCEYLLWLRKGALYNNAGMNEVPSEVKRGKVLRDYGRDSITAEQRESGHPTPKPLELIENQLQLCSKPGDVVADPYGGTGTTLLAAERTGRRGIYMDNHAPSADCALSWLELSTGEQAVKVNE